MSGSCILARQRPIRRADAERADVIAYIEKRLALSERFATKLPGSAAAEAERIAELEVILLDLRAGEHVGAASGET